MLYKKNIFLVVFVSAMILNSACTKIHMHAKKDLFPEKKPRQEKLYFSYGLKSKKGEESGDIYIVKEGDSLFSISLLYDVNYKSIAKWNNIKKPYKISVGDKILIKSKNLRVDNKLKDSSIKFSSNIQWTRPHNGMTSKEFSYSDIGKKGIDISGKLGDEIYSASDGLVVYAGDGIKGYGNLVIIKHNDIFLTAYAHTREILVNEKGLVKKGQVIATLGDTDSIKPILHFQIRKNGKSVDPEKYLP